MHVSLVKDKETATKIASDAASTLTPVQPSADGDPQDSASGTAQAQGSASVPTGGGSDLDAYIKNLLSMPAPGGTAENQDGASPPPPGELRIDHLILRPLKQHLTRS